MLVDALTLEDVEVGEGDGGASRVAAEREPVEEARGAVAEGLVQPLICNHGAHGEVARGHALAARDDVGHNAVTRGRKVPATKVIPCTGSGGVDSGVGRESTYSPRRPKAVMVSSHTIMTPYCVQISRTRCRYLTKLLQIFKV